jgi:quercetin dioxygenase-like cupin family protein
MVQRERRIKPDWLKFLAILAATISLGFGLLAATGFSQTERANKTAEPLKLPQSKVITNTNRENSNTNRQNSEKPSQQSGISRTDLLRSDLSVSGRETIQVRVDFDPEAAFPKHKHPGEEIVYVLEGLLEYEVEGKPPVTLKAGEVLFIPAGVVHSAKNVGRGNGSELATYIVEKGKPLVTLVK